MSTAPIEGRHGVAMLVMAFPPKAVGGAEQQCLRLSRNLVRNGIPVRVLTEGGPGMASYELMDGIAVHRLFCAPGGWMLRAIDVVAHLVPRRKPANPPRPDGLPYDPADSGIRLRNATRESIRYAMFLLHAFPVLWRCRREVRVIHVHIVPWMSFVGAVLGWLSRRPVVVKESTVTGAATLRQLPCGGWMLRFVRNRCTFIAMTRAIRDALIAQGIDEKRIEMIPNGVEYTEAAALPREPHTCLTVANLSQGAAKGLDVLFRSWVEVLRAFPGAKLWVAGSGDVHSFDRYLEGLGIRSAVDFLGPVRDLRPLYARAAVVAVPSRREGMSNALLEAMAAGSPIVATRISGAEDLIRPGVEGELVERDDVRGLAERILGFFNDPDRARRCGAQAQRTVLEQCAMNRVVDLHLALYAKLHDTGEHFGGAATP